MKVFAMLAGMMWWAVAAYAQLSEEYKNDPNDAYAGYSDRGFMELTESHLCVVNGVVVKSDIGLDRRYLEPVEPQFPMWIKGIGSRNDSVYIESRDVFDKTKGPGYVMIGNVKCYGMNFYTYKKKGCKLMSLDEYRRKYYPQLKGDVVYMINKFFIMKDVDLYKIDVHFVMSSEVMNSKYFDAIKRRRKFRIMRIFTQNVHNRSYRYNEWSEPVF